MTETNNTVADQSLDATNYDSIMSLLSEPFPKEMLRYNAAKKLTYVPIAEVIARLNRVLGVQNWSTEIVNAWREPDYPDWVLARVRLSITIGNKTISREGVGGQQVKFKKTGDVVDIGDEYKGAYSDALKKAAQSLGVGLELARTDEALAYDEEVYDPPTPVEQTPSEKMYATLKGHLDNMTPEAKVQMKAWWSEQYPESGPPSSKTPVAALNEAIVHAVKFSMPGSELVDIETGEIQ